MKSESPTRVRACWGANVTEVVVETLLGDANPADQFVALGTWLMENPDVAVRSVVWVPSCVDYEGYLAVYVEGSLDRWSSVVYS